MASFDIKSLFTNIPLEETVKIASENSSTPLKPLENLLNPGLDKFYLLQRKT